MKKHNFDVAVMAARGWCTPRRLRPRCLRMPFAEITVTAETVKY
jgi:hypothetical protein